MLNIGNSAQYELTKEFSLAVSLAIELQNPDASLTFTGHSLGGGLASIGALSTGNDAVIFNAAAVGENTLFINDVDIVNSANSIDVINTSGDPVSNAQLDAGWPALGTHYIIGDPSADTMVSAHGINTVQVELIHLYHENCQQGVL